MTRAWLLLLAGCGRIDFAVLDDARSDAGGDSGGDSARDTAIGGYPGPFDQLLVWYAMDDEPLDGAHDDSGQGRDAFADMGNDDPMVVPGRIGMGFVLPPLSFLHVAHVAAFDNLPAFTIAFWVRPSRPEWTGVSKTVGALTANSFELGTNPFGELQVCTATNMMMSMCMATAGSSVPLNTWSHVAVTWTGTTLQLYSGGVPGNAGPKTGIVWDMHGLMLGAEESSGGFNFFLEGALDDVRVYSRALTPQEIAGVAAP